VNFSTYVNRNGGASVGVTGSNGASKGLPRLRNIRATDSKPWRV